MKDSCTAQDKASPGKEVRNGNEPHAAHTGKTEPDFCGIKQQAVLTLPLGWDADLSQGCQQHLFINV